MKRFFKSGLPFIVGFFLILFIYLKKVAIFKYYPPIVNFCFFGIFFVSLFGEKTVIQKIAEITDGELSPEIKKYTLNLTYVWCVFLWLNFLVSFATVYMNDKIWFVYNGFISYLSVGSLFVIEYAVRVNFKKKHNLK